MFERFPHAMPTMRNPFIVLRFVLFAILIYVNLLMIGFAVWNLSVLKSLNVDGLGAPTFVIFNACLLLLLVIMCFVSSWYPNAVFDKVRYECGWTSLLSALQLASSIDVTVNGPPALCQGIAITACASSSLMVVLSWVSSTLTLIYSFSLLTTAITHMSLIPGVWTYSVHEVPWFTAPSDHLESRMPSPEKARKFEDEIKHSSAHFPTPIFEQHAKVLAKFPVSPTTPPIWQSRRSSVPTIDVTASKRTTWTNRIFSGASALTYKRSNESLRPSWAKQSAGRRGVDHPFAVAAPKPAPLPTIRPLRTLKLKSCWSPSTASSHSHTAFSALGSPRSPPVVPPKARIAGAAPQLAGPALSPTSTFYIDLERDAVVPVGAAPLRPVSYGMFPEDVVDPDMPVTHSRPSEWVRADSPASSVRSR
ncbi:hypothetical protein C8Q70DRAFT_32016 [Cubamyces menziesii]|uniref:Uncharacterized protein n=1 Tax=Trametes cubensis TaxID=1111947 RepID=A0AAD7TIV4_9APHY|nr:hypothetical protein C8Q70DRAFT_32016 [Cubamyces menziesii]KAJ8462347.1 hypothetical protein ONZ51_g10961 [Trametes cubensis]